MYYVNDNLAPSVINNMFKKLPFVQSQLAD